VHYNDDEINGMGIYHSTNGEIYEGEWKDDKNV
jgi:hypothetical protein